MTLETIHIYSQGVVREQSVHKDVADQIVSRLQREGYTCWRVHKDPNQVSEQDLCTTATSNSF